MACYLTLEALLFLSTLFPNKVANKVSAVQFICHVEVALAP